MRLVLVTTFLPMCLGLNLFVPSPLKENELEKNLNEIPLVDLQPANAPLYSPLVKNADVCDPKKCGLPNCFCSGWTIPGGLKVKEVPQMIILSFQNAVNVVNYDRYMKLFHNRKNPNGCPKTGTFYVSHNYTNYWQVQSLAASRQEIGVNSVSSPRPLPETEAQWVSQLQSQKDILSKWAQIPSRDVHSFRAPFLMPGGDMMINAMQKAKLSIDSTRSTIRFMESPRLLWPYTYDYASSQDCVTGHCPVNAHKGVWEVPIEAWKDKDGDFYPTPYGCQVETKEEALHLLINKVVAHRNSSNRAPLVITLDSAWLVDDDKFEATRLFLDLLDSFKDTYAVSAWQAVQWIQHPTKLSEINSFKPWQCKEKPPSVCPLEKATTCQFDAARKLIKPGEGTPIYTLVTCELTCPQCYPWIDDAMGKKC